MSESTPATPEPWFLYTTSDPPPSQPAAATGGGATVIIDRGEAPWKSFGTSMNAISFGFVATAILISMFLIMAIFEHLFRPSNPSSSFSSPQDDVSATSRSDHGAAYPEAGYFHKLGNPQMVRMASDYSVVMPGHHFPSYIAQPAPLPPCPRETICWPSHTA
ncbi:unnamed protein product [Linum trigynum]|uniref:Uncharacterized protein n=1 Tax=Linum trigynum TaxID=586398 RepID=A0AAV2C7P0_9ROSI